MFFRTSFNFSFTFHLEQHQSWCVCVSLFFRSRGGYMNTGTSQSLSGALNRQNQLMQGSGLQGGAFGRRYWCLSEDSNGSQEVMSWKMWPLVLYMFLKTGILFWHNSNPFLTETVFLSLLPNYFFSVQCDVVISCLVLAVSFTPTHLVYCNTNCVLARLCWPVVERHVRALCCKFRCFIDTGADGPTLTCLLSISQFVSEIFWRLSILMKWVFVPIHLFRAWGFCLTFLFL